MSVMVIFRQQPLHTGRDLVTFPEHVLSEEKTKPKPWLFVRILFGTLCVAYVYFYLVSTMPDPAVVDECEGIATLVSSASRIPQSVSIPSRPAFFCEKGLQGVRLSSFDHVKIYGVTDRNQQDVLVAHMRLARQRLKTRMIIVDFYEKKLVTLGWTLHGEGQEGNAD